MTLNGHVENGVIVIDEQTSLPDGTSVTIEIIDQSTGTTEKSAKRQGGWWKGQVESSDDFDELPDDIAEAFGMRDELSYCWILTP